MSFSKVRIADTIAEDAIAISPFALVERLRSFRRRFLKHDSSHRAMVEIAQRSEVHLWMRFMVSPCKEFHAANRNGAERQE